MIFHNIKNKLTHKNTKRNSIKDNKVASDNKNASDDHLADNDKVASGNNFASGNRMGTIDGNTFQANIDADPEFRRDIAKKYNNSNNKKHYIHFGKDVYNVNVPQAQIMPSNAFKGKFSDKATMNAFMKELSVGGVQGISLAASKANSKGASPKVTHPTAPKYVQMQNRINDLEQKLQTVTRQRDEARQENKAKDGVNKSLKTLNNAYKEMHTSDQQTHRVDEQLHKSDQNKIKAQQKTIDQEHSASSRPKSEEAKPESSTSASSSVRPRNFVRGYAPLHASEGPFRPINQPSNNSDGPESSGPSDGGPDL